MSVNLGHIIIVYTVNVNTQEMMTGIKLKCSKTNRKETNIFHTFVCLQTFRMCVTKSNKPEIKAKPNGLKE